MLSSLYIYIYIYRNFVLVVEKIMAGEWKEGNAVEKSVEVL
jgi:hypothetical protein